MSEENRTMQTDQWLAQYKEKIEGMKRAAVELEDNLASATVTTSSPDGSVTVTVGPNGSLRDLQFSHRAAEHSHAELAALVMKTVANGQRAVSEKVVEAFAPIGAGTSAMELLTRFTPKEPEEPETSANAYDELAPEAPAQPAAPPEVVPPQPAPVPQAASVAARPRPAARPADDDGDEFEGRPW